MKNDNNSHPNQTTAVSPEIEKATSHIIVEIVEYVPNAVVIRTIIKKITGDVTALSISEGEELAEKIVPFDTYIQIIDGAADLTIDKKKYQMKVGSGMVIPAHSSHHFNASEQFKMISTTIKNGYES
jgi:quercetin dioxygenase-like cupin family protein